MNRFTAAFLDELCKTAGAKAGFMAGVGKGWRAAKQAVGGAAGAIGGLGWHGLRAAAPYALGATALAAPALYLASKGVTQGLREPVQRDPYVI